MIDRRDVLALGILGGTALLKPVRVDNGKFAEHWDIVDCPGLQNQLRGE